jgi:hypothetical protein
MLQCFRNVDPASVTTVSRRISLPASVTPHLATLAGFTNVQNGITACGNIHFQIMSKLIALFFAILRMRKMACGMPGCTSTSTARELYTHI